MCKEVARIVDVIGFKEIDLLTLPQESGWSFVHIIYLLIDQSEHLKLQGLVLRIYRLIFVDWNTDNCDIRRKTSFCSCVLYVAIHMLRREKSSDILNEHLCNGTAILHVAWMKNRKICFDIYYVDALVNVVIICVSRFRELHVAATAHDAQASSRSISVICYENETNIKLIGAALDLGLSLISSLLTDTSLEEDEEEFLCESKIRLRNLDIVNEIVRMVKLVLAGCKFFHSIHFQFGINIAAALYKEEGGQKRNEVVEAFGDLLRSNIVDEFGTEVKLLLQDILRDFNVHVLNKTQ